VTYISAKFLGPSGGTISNAVKAVKYLTDLKVKYGVNIVAINNSWGGGGYSTDLYNAIQAANNAGILFVAAAGNDGRNTDSSTFYPAGYNVPNVISVGAIDKSGKLASFSNYGSKSVDLVAPGVAVNSTVPGSSYASYNGTSMATPHVTGAIALYKAKYPEATAEQIKNALYKSAYETPTSSAAGKTATGGRLNISAMLNITPETASSFVLPTTSSGSSSGSSSTPWWKRLSSRGDNQDADAVFAEAAEVVMVMSFDVNVSTSSAQQAVEAPFVPVPAFVKAIPATSVAATSTVQLLNFSPVYLSGGPAGLASTFARKAAAQAQPPVDATPQAEPRMQPPANPQNQDNQQDQQGRLQMFQGEEQVETSAVAFSHDGEVVSLENPGCVYVPGTNQLAAGVVTGLVLGINWNALTEQEPRKKSRNPYWSRFVS
jgi:hypothetical protein